MSLVMERDTRTIREPSSGRRILGRLWDEALRTVENDRVSLERRALTGRRSNSNAFGSNSRSSSTGERPEGRPARVRYVFD